jgi:hypothetical protein
MTVVTLAVAKRHHRRSGLRVGSGGVLLRRPHFSTFVGRTRSTDSVSQRICGATSMPPRCLLKKVFLIRTRASLLGFLLLCQSCGWNRKNPPPYGYLLDIAKVPAPDRLATDHSRCGNLSYVIVTAAGKGRATLNGEIDITLDQLSLRVREIMRYRALKLVYVKGGSGVSWADFVGMLALNADVRPSRGIHTGLHTLNGRSTRFRKLDRRYPVRAVSFQNRFTATMANSPGPGCSKPVPWLQ